MVTTATSKAVLQEDYSRRENDGKIDSNNNQKMTEAIILPRHMSPDLRRKPRRHEVRRAVSFSAKHPLLREMRLFARSLSRGSSDRIDVLDDIGSVFDSGILHLSRIFCVTLA